MYAERLSCVQTGRMDRDGCLSEIYAKNLLATLLLILSPSNSQNRRRQTDRQTGSNEEEEGRRNESLEIFTLLLHILCWLRSSVVSKDDVWRAAENPEHKYVNKKKKKTKGEGERKRKVLSQRD